MSMRALVSSFPTTSQYCLAGLPGSELVDCDVVGSQLDLIFQNRLGGRALVYYGLGGSFQSITLEDDLGELIDGDFWGFNLVFGGRYNEGETVQPFLEIRWTGLEEIDNQFALTLGATVAVGG